MFREWESSCLRCTSSRIRGSYMSLMGCMCVIQALINPVQRKMKFFKGE